jgi:uncharacterized protein with HEPN domain
MVHNPRDIKTLEKSLEIINRLDTFMHGITLESFMANDEKKHAVGMCLINLGEMFRRLSDDIRKQSKIPFKDIIGLRDIAAHGYGSLRFDFIWKLVQDDIPILKKEISKLLK